MITSLNIRAVTNQDYGQWLPLWEGYNAFYGRTGSTTLPLEITKKTWSRFIDETEPVFALVAERDGKLIGLTHYIFHRSTSSLTDTCYLQDLFTQENERGRGVGRMLINAVHAKATEAGLGRVYWQTHETNTTAIELYNKLAVRSGFIVYRMNIS
jgi:GNAT superfamily N-acetyltransferase